MLHVARKLALLLVVALLYVPAAARAQQHLQPTGGASLTKFSKSAEGTREKIAGIVVFAAAVSATPAQPPIARRVPMAFGAAPAATADQTAADGLRAPPSL
jgi:hypothetical protein